MAVLQQNLPLDNSTLANFLAWVNGISTAFSTLGWVQSTDTGQVMLSGMNITAVSVTGSNATYTYNSLTGQTLAVGRALTITGLVNSVNNGVKVITALGSGTFTVLNASGVNESGSAGRVTAISSVPSNALVYEVWTSADTLSSTLPIYVKIEYGYSSSTPIVRVTPGTGSYGAGSIKNIVTDAPWEISVSGYNSQTETNQGNVNFPCYFSGDAGEIRMSLWQHPSLYTGVIFGIERSKDSLGVATGSYFTALSIASTSNNNYSIAHQQTMFISTRANIEYGLITPALTTSSIRTTTATGAYNGSIASFPVFPVLGHIDNPMLGWQSVCGNDVSDGVQFVVNSLYGTAHNFLCIKNGVSGALGGRTAPMALLMRYE